MSIETRAPVLRIVRAQESLQLNSSIRPLAAGGTYRLSIAARGFQGSPFSSSIVVIILQRDGQETARCWRWISDFSGELRFYHIVFTAPKGASGAVLGYRVNVETPLKCDVAIELPDPEALSLEPVESSAGTESDGTPGSRTEGFIRIRVPQNGTYCQNSEWFKIEVGRYYKAIAPACLRLGAVYSAFMFAAALDAQGRELERHVKWFRRTGSEAAAYHLGFVAPAGACSASLGYRVNAETPMSSAVEIDLEPLAKLQLGECADPGYCLKDDPYEYRNPPGGELILPADTTFSEDGPRIMVLPNQTYRVSPAATLTACEGGKVRFCLRVFDTGGLLLAEHFWPLAGPVDHSNSDVFVFRTTAAARSAAVGYRAKSMPGEKAELRLRLPNLHSLALEPVDQSICLPVLRITHVEAMEPDPDAPGELTLSFDAPRGGEAFETQAFEVRGWILGNPQNLESIQFRHQKLPIRNLPASALMPPKGTQTGGLPDQRLWFSATLGTVGLPSDFHIDIQASMTDGQTWPLGCVSGSRRAVRSAYNPSILPIMLTCTGRTGTSWVVRLLESHPAVIAHPLHQEIRAASYWAHCLKVLSDPSNEHESLTRGDCRSNPWWTGHHPFYSSPVTDIPGLRRWFGGTYVEELAGFFHRCIDSFYREMAANLNKPASRYFVEKVLPGWYVPRLLWELYPSAREIFLIRDLRDMVCSIFAFNQKRGYDEFGRQDAESDEDFIRGPVVRGSTRLLADWQARRDRAILVRYEDLVFHPIETLTGMLEYIELEHSPSLINEMLRAAGERGTFLRWHSTTENARESVGRWRRELSPALQETCHEALADLLREFGYVE